MATLLKADRTSEVVLPKNGKEFMLEELQAAVGGYIELVHLRDGHTMVVNEDGHALGLLPNTEASRLYGDLIVGDVLICSGKEIS